MIWWGVGVSHWAGFWDRTWELLNKRICATHNLDFGMSVLVIGFWNFRILVVDVNYEPSTILFIHEINNKEHKIKGMPSLCLGLCPTMPWASSDACLKQSKALHMHLPVPWAFFAPGLSLTTTAFMHYWRRKSNGSNLRYTSNTTLLSNFFHPHANDSYLMISIKDSFLISTELLSEKTKFFTR